jgi:hypothetical protein
VEELDRTVELVIEARHERENCGSFDLEYFPRQRAFSHA